MNGIYIVQAPSLTNVWNFDSNLLVIVLCAIIENIFFMFSRSAKNDLRKLP